VIATRPVPVLVLVLVPVLVLVLVLASVPVTTIIVSHAIPTIAIIVIRPVAAVVIARSIERAIVTRTLACLPFGSALMKSPIGIATIVSPAARTLVPLELRPYLALRSRFHPHLGGRCRSLDLGRRPACRPVELRAHFRPRRLGFARRFGTMFAAATATKAIIVIGFRLKRRRHAGSQQQH
jgi:hypothetical protein